MTFCRTVSSASGTKRRRETVYHSSGRTCHQVGLAHVRLDDRRSACDHPASCRPRAEVRRRPQSDAPRRPYQHVDPRGGTYSVIDPMMGVFNNLVLYDQHVPQNSLATIRPELATEWTRDEDGPSLTSKLRQGVKA